MNKLTRLLIAAFLLLPSVALAQFDPTTHPNILYYIPNQQDEPGAFFQAITATGDLADTVADPIGTIVTGVGGVAFSASSDAVRLGLAADGAIQGAAGDGIRHTSVSYANTIHENRRAWFIAVITMNDGVTLATRPILDNTNQAANGAAGAQGFTLGVHQQPSGQTFGGVLSSANASSARARLQHATGTSLELITEEAITAATATRHVIMGYFTPTGLSYLQVDKGRKSYGRVGAAGSGNAPFGMFLLNRASLNLELLAKVHAVGVYTDYPGDDALDEWLERFPVGNIVGSPEIRCGDLHANCSKTQGYIPYCIWYKNRRVSPVSSTGSEDGEGAVFNDGVSSVGGWVGGPHGNETITSKTVSVDGVTSTLTDGEIYEGSTIRVVRESTMGASFYLTETTTWTNSTRRTRARMVRRNDGRTISSSFYIVRNARELDYQDYLAFDIDGNVLDDDTVTVDVDCPAGTVAVAQWSSDAGQMILTTMTEGYELDHTFLLVGDTYNTRLYNRINNANSTVENDVLEMEILVKHYETTAGAWKALAASELGAILNPPKGNQRIGLGIGIGLGSVERKNPAQRLAAAFNHEFSVAP